MESIKLLVTGNAGVYRGMLLGAISAAMHTELPIELHIGTMDERELDPRYIPISEAEREELEGVLREKNPLSSATLHDLTESFERELKESKNIDGRYTPYAMIRLFADELPGIGDKLLYMDTDVLIKSSLAELWETDVQDYHMAGARDRYGKFFFGINYLNSGVLLFNMKKMKEDGVFKKCRILCRDKKMLLFDQHALNKYAKKKLILPKRFNEQKRTVGDTVIRHFSMTISLFPYLHTKSIKPWQREEVENILGETSHKEVYERYEKILISK
ncbi:MAG: hypothetical protein IJY18_00715 [Clostridia bacterium]|nr:hypothetical protein [Clostridia bacterium]